MDIMFNQFASDLKNYIMKTNNRLLREELNEVFKDEQNVEKIIAYLQSQQMTESSYFFLTKFLIQNKFKKLEKYFHQCTAVTWLYCRKEDDVYMLTSPNLRKQLDVEYGVLFNEEHRWHFPYMAIQMEEILYWDYRFPVNKYLVDANKIWYDHGYKSGWHIPIRLEGKVIGILGLIFDYCINDLPTEMEQQLIIETLNDLEKEFKVILENYDKFKVEEHKKIL